MKITEKKDKKAVSFYVMNVLEKNSENMEKMTAFMDKMFINLDQKNVPYKPKIYQKKSPRHIRPRGRQNDSLRGRSYSRDRNTGNFRGYGCGNVRGCSNFRWGRFRDRENWSRDKDSRTWRQSRSQERREGRRNDGMHTWSSSSSRSWSSSRFTINRDRVRCFRCREYDHFANECPNQANESDRESDSVRSSSLQILADSDVESEEEITYLNI